MWRREIPKVRSAAARIRAPPKAAAPYWRDHVGANGRNASAAAPICRYQIWRRRMMRRVPQCGSLPVPGLRGFFAATRLWPFDKRGMLALQIKRKLWLFMRYDAGRRRILRATARLPVKPRSRLPCVRNIMLRNRPGYASPQTGTIKARLHRSQGYGRRLCAFHPVAAWGFWRFCSVLFSRYSGKF